MADTDAWMPLYIGDYLRKTMRLTAEQHGAYLLLIMDYWQNGPAPDNDVVLSQIARLTPDAWSNARSILAQYFDVRDGHWFHNRLEEELAEASRRKGGAKAKAAAAAKARWEKKRAAEKASDDAPSNASSIAPSTPQAMPEECPSPSPSPIETNTVPSERAPDEPAQSVVSAFPISDHDQSPQALKEQVFGPCLTWLASKSGKPPNSLRSLIGKWCRDHGDSAVVTAFLAANRQSPVDPVPWLQAHLTGSGGRYSQAAQDTRDIRGAMGFQ